jgi:hypothetical protein
MINENAPISTIEPVKKTIQVNLNIEEAFNLFTQRIHTWWPLDEGHSVGGGNSETCAIEGKEGGRVYETLKDGTEAIWGTVQVFEPPYKFATTWHPGNPSELATYLEVHFTALDDGTVLELTHSGWEARGEEAQKYRDGYNSGWDFVLGEFLKLVIS